MCERGRIFNAGFAVFCAVFRRGERRCASWDAFLTRGLQGSAQCFVGARGCGERGCFLLKLLD